VTATTADTPPSPTVQCPNCDTVLAEVVAPGKLKRGPMTVSGPSGRGIRVECDCGHTFRWLGASAVDVQDVHHVVEKREGERGA
jgi:ribosomal protein S27E